MLENPLIAALDVDDEIRALDLAQKLGGHVGALKVGPRLIVRYGGEFVAKLARLAPVFVDNKYFDIPSTMEGAVQATFDAGATFATIHAGAGPETLGRMAALERRLNERRPFKILSVTILTSYTEETLPPNLIRQTVQDHVIQLARSVFDAGLTGIVCSPLEVAAVKALNTEAYLVTPGVRLATDERGDQARVETPREAIAQGASALVIGRPIFEAADPAASAAAILRSLK